MVTSPKRTHSDPPRFLLREGRRAQMLPLLNYLGISDHSHQVVGVIHDCAGLETQLTIGFLGKAQAAPAG